jgi:hypothetical protein
MRLGCIIIPFLLSLAVEANGIMQADPRNPVCLMKTSMGDVYIELFANEAPKTVRNFIELAEGRKAFTDFKTDQKMKRPFYDGLIFHRVIEDPTSGLNFTPMHIWISFPLLL